jgi:hypothetical protein
VLPWFFLHLNKQKLQKSSSYTLLQDYQQKKLTGIFQLKYWLWDVYRPERYTRVSIVLSRNPRFMIKLHIDWFFKHCATEIISVATHSKFPCVTHIIALILTESNGLKLSISQLRISKILTDNLLANRRQIFFYFFLISDSSVILSEQ